jgi:hypothetical protein
MISVIFMAEAAPWLLNSTFRPIIQWLELFQTPMTLSPPEGGTFAVAGGVP